MIIRDQFSADQGVRFLAQAGETLAGSLDWEDTLVQVSRLVVPALADWCIVDVLDEDGVTIKQVAVSAADPHKEDVLREMRLLYPPTLDSPQPAARTLRSGEPVVFAEFDSAALEATTRDRRHYELISQLDPKSVLAVPLVARARTIGALTLATSDRTVATGPTRSRSPPGSRAARHSRSTTPCCSRASERPGPPPRRPSADCATSR